MQLFRGYVETKNKKCTEKFKDRTDLKSFEEVQHLPEYAGILASDVVLIDIDDQEQSEIMMNIVEDLQLNCRVYKTTRGRHFLFKNKGITKGGNSLKLGCCLISDIKVGANNSYSVLKFDKKERFIEWDIEEGQEYQEVPKWLYPIKGASIDFLDMKAGDGRNQALFNYILTLQAADFSVDEARETIRIINNHVMKEPLSENELEVVLRDDAFKKPIFFRGSTFLFDKFATYLKNNNHIIKLNNQLHIYQDGIYIDGQQKIEAEMIRHIPSLNRSKRTEVMAYLNLLVRDNSEPSGAEWVAFRNGVVNVITGEFEGFSPDKIITNRIDWNYDPSAVNSDGAKLVDSVLNKIACHDKQVRMLLEEALGYCFYRRNELGKAFILIGDRSNGKSTFLDMVKTVLGDGNIASLDLGELGDRFKTAELFGKLCNIGDDIGDEFIANAAIFKKLVTGDRISVERKGQDPFEFNNYSKMLFSANNIPRIKDKTGAVQRRLTIIPFDAKFTKDDPDYRPFIKYELRDQECVEFMILKGLEGLKRVLVNQEFTSSVRVNKELEEYEETNNPVIGFLKEYDREALVNQPTKTVYRTYNEYCLANNLQPLSNIEFSKVIKKKFDFEIISKKVDGKVFRLFVER